MGLELPKDVTELFVCTPKAGCVCGNQRFPLRPGFVYMLQLGQQIMPPVLENVVFEVASTSMLILYLTSAPTCRYLFWHCDSGRKCCFLVFSLETCQCNDEAFIPICQAHGLWSQVLFWFICRPFSLVHTGCFWNLRCFCKMRVTCSVPFPLFSILRPVKAKRSLFPAACLLIIVPRSLQSKRQDGLCLSGWASINVPRSPGVPGLFQAHRRCFHALQLIAHEVHPQAEWFCSAYNSHPNGHAQCPAEPWNRRASSTAKGTHRLPPIKLWL